jgi:hypothetical protein
LAQPLIPARGRQRVEGLIEAEASAGNEIRTRLRDWVQLREHFDGDDLLALFLACRAIRNMMLEFMRLFVGQLPIRGGDQSFLCKFAIHGYVLPAPKDSF